MVALSLIMIGLVLILYRYEKAKLSLAELRHEEIVRNINNINLDIDGMKRSMNSRGKNI